METSDPADEAAQELKRRIERLIQQLDSDRYSERRLAEGELCRLGRPALEAVREAARGSAREASIRAARVLRRLEEQIRLESIINVQPSVEELAVVVVDNCDPNYQGAGPHGDSLRFLARNGARRFSRTGFNNCEHIGLNHGVALDPRRARIYIREMVPDRLLAFDPHGTLVFEKQNVEGVSALAVHPETGHVWCATGGTLGQGQIIVLDDRGEVVAVHEHAAFDLVWSVPDGAFWLAGQHLTKVAADGRALFQSDRAGWAYVSLAVDARQGGVWVLERQHSQIQASSNQLLRFDASGKLLRTVPIDEMLPMGVACHPVTGEVWVILRRTGVLRFSPDGATKQTLPLSAEGIAIGPESGAVWIATTDRVLRLDEQGQPAAEHLWEGRTSHCWMAAY